MRGIGWLGAAIVSGGLLGQASPAGWVIEENFESDPAARGWQVFGDESLFHWEPASQQLEVTWDSSRSNSFFYLPLGATLRKTNEFDLSFRVSLEEINIGTTPGKPYTFEIALGLLNLADATQASFLRGTGFSSPNLLEWDYFPDSGFGATVSSTIISEEHQWASGFNSPQPLDLNVEYRFRLWFTPEDRRLRTTLQVLDTVVTLEDVTLNDEFDDFSLDTLAVASYSDAGQDPQFAGSVLARGKVDALRIVEPPRPIRDFTGAIEDGTWRATFVGRSDHRYTIESSSDLRAWSEVGTEVQGTDERQAIEDSRPSSGHLFYRLKATRQ